VTRLLEITHGQWIDRNLIFHKNTTGTLVTQNKETLMAEIIQHIESGRDGLSEEDGPMVKVNIEAGHLFGRTRMLLAHCSPNGTRDLGLTGA
jgi:hypothetical protein